MTGSVCVERLPAGSAAVDAELEAFFAACPTSFAQQTPAWRNVIASLGEDEPLFLGCRQGRDLVGVLPAYHFQGPLGGILTSCAQAGPLGGVAVLPDANARPVYRALLGRFVELAADRSCAVATAIGNPFWPDAGLYEEFLAPDYTLQNVCQVLDLESALDADGNFTGGTRHLRRNLRKAQSGRLSVDEAQTAANVEEWYELHAARHREIGATPLPRTLVFAALEHAVPRGKARFFFVRTAEGGEMAAGGLYLCHGRVIDAFMPSLRGEFAGLAPNYLLALHSQSWARARGIRWYNWQASPPDGGVHRFKRQWGSRDAVYYYFTRITGDVEPFHRSTVAFVRDAYSGHYVMPFDKIGVEPSATLCVSSREDAWHISTGGDA